MSKASQDETNGVSIKGGVIINAVSNPCLSKRRISGCGRVWGWGIHQRERGNLILSAFGLRIEPPTTSTNDSAESHSSTLLAGVDQDGHRSLYVCRRSIMAYASRKPLMKEPGSRLGPTRLKASPVSTSAEAGQRGCLNNSPRV